MIIYRRIPCVLRTQSRALSITNGPVLKLTNLPQENYASRKKPMFNEAAKNMKNTKISTASMSTKTKGGI